MKKHLKFLALAVAAALLVGLAWFANSLVGNPISKALATRSAQSHLTELLPNTDYTMERIAYSFKDGCYHAFYTSPTNIDGDFSAVFTQTGKYRYDTYDSVLDGFNTAYRLEMDYRELTDTVLESPGFPYSLHIGYGTLEIYPQEAIDDPNVTDIPDYAIVQDELTVNGVYDVRALGAQAGKLVLYVESDTVDCDTAARILLHIRQLMDEAGIPFRSVSFVLWYPKAADDTRSDGEIHIRELAYAHITPDGMTDRVRTAAEETANYYARLDKESGIK